MNFLQGFFMGVKAYGKAADILFSRQFAGFLLFPFAALLLLFLGGNWLVSTAGEGLSEMLRARIDSWCAGISWLSWLNEATNIIVVVLLKIVYFFLFLTFGAYLVLIVMSPVYSWLSERTEAYLTGKQYPFSLRQFIREIVRGVGIAFRNMFVQLVISLLLLLLSFVPVVGLLSPLALFFVSAYFYGFSFIDYAIERKRFNIKQSVSYVNRHSGVVTGIGTVFALSFLFPCLSIVLGCLVSLLSVIAGTIAVDKLTKMSA